MVGSERLICPSSALVEAGDGVRFSVWRGGREVPAFVIRYEGRVCGYLNQCAHVPVELDWLPGQFFDFSKVYLICSVHGALYSPLTGQCMGGRCHGVGLHPVQVVERDGNIYLVADKKNGLSPAV